MEGSDRRPGLNSLGPDVWCVDRPLEMWLGDIGSRMTIVRLASGELLLHSPVALDEDLRRAVASLGPVRWIVGPSKVHHLFLEPWVVAFPDAALCGAPGLPAKRRDLDFDVELDRTPRDWPEELPFLVFGGAPLMNEVVFCHVPSRTLILTDLSFNVQRGPSNRAAVFHALVGATGRFGPHRLIRIGIRNREAAQASVRSILEWDFDRVVLSHGAVVSSGGRDLFVSAFRFLGAAS